MMPSNIKKICSIFRKRKCTRKIFIVFVTLSDLNKTSNRAVGCNRPVARKFSVGGALHFCRGDLRLCRGA